MTISFARATPTNRGSSQVFPLSGVNPFVTNGTQNLADGVATTTSALNAVAGEVNANGAIVPLDSGVDSCLFTQSGGNFVVDLSGWWVR